MDRIIFENIEYYRRDKQWTDNEGDAVNDELQQKLNRVYIQQAMERSREEAALIRAGDAFLKEGNFGFALEKYRQVLESGNKRNIRTILPNAMTCLLLMKRAEDVTALYELVCRTDYESAQTAEVLALNALAYYERQNYKQTLHFSERALAIDQHNQHAISAHNHALRKIEDQATDIELSTIEIKIGTDTNNNE